jgi:Berberine and berberine like
VLFDVLMLGVYQVLLDPNYVDPTLTPAQWKSQYYGSNYPQLLSIKKMYDPHDVFDYPQAIGRA